MKFKTKARRREFENKVLGGMFGFAIGDAMGATTEFMSQQEIKKQYGKVDKIIGGGWLNIEAGQVTDDSQMMLCVCEALTAHTGGEKEFLDITAANLIKWFKSNPIDVGNQVKKVIEQHTFNGDDTDSDHWLEFAKDANAMGNGGLIRAYPAILVKKRFAAKQASLTHNSFLYSVLVGEYGDIINAMLDNYVGILDEPHFKKKLEPTGHILNTLYNAVGHVNDSLSVEDAIISAVNAGGDADSIAAIAGSISGTLYGFDSIPTDLITQLDKSVTGQLFEATENLLKLIK